MAKFHVVWITGASSGIGRELALLLAREGSAVGATARRGGDLAALAAEVAAEGAPGRILPLAGDVTNRAGMVAAAQGLATEAGPIDLAILNAGLYRPIRVAPFEPEKFDETFAVNLGGVVNGLNAVLPGMIARGAGRIIIIASVAGYGGLPTSAAYGASKAALFNLAMSLKFDLAPRGITIQVVAPGFVKTALTEKAKFPIPFRLPVDEAARRIRAGLDGNRFEITFPRRFTYLLKLLNALPYGAYYAIVRRGTGGVPR